VVHKVVAVIVVAAAVAVVIVAAAVVAAVVVTVVVAATEDPAQADQETDGINFSSKTYSQIIASSYRSILFL
jgi:hypothetical protein